jgi:homoserine O-succinyltransferase
MAETPPRPAGWQEGAAGLFRNWLAFASARAALAA